MKCPKRNTSLEQETLIKINALKTRETDILYNSGNDNSSKFTFSEKKDKRKGYSRQEH